MSKKPIEQYQHLDEERSNIPHVGLVTPVTDPDTGLKKGYQYDPYLDPSLQWASKAEHMSFEVPTVSLHVHERIDPKTIINSTKKNSDKTIIQEGLFDEKKPLREAIEFYKHSEGWSNRLIAGDSLLIMNSLLEKEGMSGKAQMLYFDPPYGISYKSNFQPFVNKKDVKDGDDKDLTSEPEMIKAYRDTWELGIHSYLNYLRDRFLLAHDLLNESGSIFVQINDENVHYIRNLLDEVFGPKNFITLIQFRTASTKPTSLMSGVCDFIVWFAKDKSKVKYHELYSNKNDIYSDGSLVDFNGEIISIKEALTRKINITNDMVFETQPLAASSMQTKYEVEFNGKIFNPVNGWRIAQATMEELKKANRIYMSGTTLRSKKYFSDFPYAKLNSTWIDMWSEQNKIYAVQTNTSVVERCMLMATDPGDLIIDPTCGSGTSAYVAEQWGRRWITCDSSRVALSLAKYRIMTASFNYYKLANPIDGIRGGFEYSIAQRKTRESIGNNQQAELITLYDQPVINASIYRVTGSFTVEAVPAPYTKSIDELTSESKNISADNSISRIGETNRQLNWRDELLRTGVRAKNGNYINFSRVEPLSGTKFIQAEAETQDDNPQKVLVVFGPEHAPLEQRVVENAWQEARALKPDILLFCAFQFDNEAAKDIDELSPEIAGMQLLKAQMNADLFTDDLKKNRSSNDSFWLVGQPDIKVHKLTDGEIKVEVMGFDYYNPIKGTLDSGGKNNIASWMVDEDYDNRSIYPSQVFFPLEDEKYDWTKLARNLKAEIDTDKIESFKGTISLPFKPGKVIAIKILDDRGLESLRVINI